MELSYATINDQLNDIFNRMTHAIDLIIKGIKLQESGRLDEEYKSVLRDLIKYDTEKNDWSGWYVDLHDNSKPIFNYDIWVANPGSFPPVEEVKFKGSKLFNSLKYPNLGIAVVEDQFEKVKKIAIFPKFNAKDYYSPFEVNPNIDELSKQITDRE